MSINSNFGPASSIGSFHVQNEPGKSSKKELEDVVGPLAQLTLADESKQEERGLQSSQSRSMREALAKVRFKVDKYEKQISHFPPFFASPFKEESVNSQFVPQGADYRMKALIKEVVSVLDRCMKIFKKDDRGGPDKFFLFRSLEKPEISLSDYLERFFRFGAMTEVGLISALVYIDKLNMRGVCVTEMHIHRLVSVAIAVAMKVYEDDCCSNEMFSKVAGVSLKEFNELEVEFFFELSFDVNIPFDKYKECESAIIQMVTRSEEAVKNIRANEEKSSCLDY